MSKQNKPSFLGILSARPQSGSPHWDRWADTLQWDVVQQIGQTILLAVNCALYLHVSEKVVRMIRAMDERRTTEIGSHDARIVKVVFFFKARIRKSPDLLGPWALSHAHEKNVRVRKQVLCGVLSTDQEGVFNAEHVSLALNTKQNSQRFQVWWEDGFDSLVADFRTHQTWAVTRSVSATSVDIDPIEANWVASRSRPCFRFGCTLVHLPIPRRVRLLLTGNLDLVWVRRPLFDVVLRFPLDLRVLVRVNWKDVQPQQRWTTSSPRYRDSNTQVWLSSLRHYLRDSLVQTGWMNLCVLRCVPPGVNARVEPSHWTLSACAMHRELANHLVNVFALRAPCPPCGGVF